LKKREHRLKKAKKVWELFLQKHTTEEIGRSLAMPESEVMAVVSFTAPEMYNIDLSNTLLVQNDELQQKVQDLEKSLENSRNMGWIPISVSVVIAAAAIILSLVIVSV
jgi:hypothetical protein